MSVCPSCVSCRSRGGPTTCMNLHLTHLAVHTPLLSQIQPKCFIGRPHLSVPVNSTDRQTDIGRHGDAQGRPTRHRPTVRSLVCCRVYSAAGAAGAGAGADEAVNPAEHEILAAEAPGRAHSFESVESSIVAPLKSALAMLLICAHPSHSQSRTSAR